MATWIWVNNGSGIELLHGGTKPLSEPTLTYNTIEILWYSLLQFNTQGIHPQVELSLKFSFTNFYLLTHMSPCGFNHMGWRSADARMSMMFKMKNSLVTVHMTRTWCLLWQSPLVPMLIISRCRLMFLVEPTKDTPYLTLTGELWGVFCEDLGENWSRFNGTALYLE